MEKLPLDPIWRQAAMDAVVEFGYGATIPREWLLGNLGIEVNKGPMTAEQHQADAFEMLRKVEGFRDAMLYEHKRLLVNVRGVGYKIIEPPHQTDAAMRRLAVDLGKTISKTMAALVNINDAVLGIEDARENAEAKNKVAWLNTVGIKQLEKAEM
jgi:hypothetical protein